MPLSKVMSKKKEKAMEVVEAKHEETSPSPAALSQELVK